MSLVTYCGIHMPTTSEPVLSLWFVMTIESLHMVSSTITESIAVYANHIQTFIIIVVCHDHKAITHGFIQPLLNLLWYVITIQ